MTDKEKVQVTAYSGYRGEECPRSFILCGETIDVVEVLGRWLEQGEKSEILKRVFQIKGNDEKTYRLYFDEQTKEWFHVR
jgi:hypothetical protein